MPHVRTPSPPPGPEIYAMASQRLTRDPTDICQASVQGKVLLPCLGGDLEISPTGNFTTVPHLLKGHKCCEEPLQLTTLRP